MTLCICYVYTFFYNIKWNKAFPSKYQRSILISFFVHDLVVAYKADYYKPETYRSHMYISFICKQFTDIYTGNPGRFAHFPFRPESFRPRVVSPTFPFAPESFRPLPRSPLSRFAPLWNFISSIIISALKVV